ncbi:hypothetical protein B0O80DRAFT_429762 [Mortierella sp. GBAus27b]|nr:hypothetical protein B0O80DRAFT_429762 [Mortierella sp. GBAus27b]
MQTNGYNDMKHIVLLLSIIVWTQLPDAECRVRVRVLIFGRIPETQLYLRPNSTLKTFLGNSPPFLRQAYKAATVLLPPIPSVSPFEYSSSPSMGIVVLLTQWTKKGCVDGWGFMLSDTWVFSFAIDLLSPVLAVISTIDSALIVALATHSSIDRADLGFAVVGIVESDVDGNSDGEDDDEGVQRIEIASSSRAKEDGISAGAVTSSWVCFIPRTACSYWSSRARACSAATSSTVTRSIFLCHPTFSYYGDTSVILVDALASLSTVSWFSTIPAGPHLTWNVAVPVVYQTAACNLSSYSSAGRASRILQIVISSLMVKDLAKRYRWYSRFLFPMPHPWSNLDQSVHYSLTIALDHFTSRCWSWRRTHEKPPRGLIDTLPDEHPRVRVYILHGREVTPEDCHRWDYG